MENLIADLLVPLALFVVVTWLVTEVVKHVVEAVGHLLGRAIVLGKASIIVAIIIAGLLSFGWALSILPEPVSPAFIPVAIVLTALIIAGAASGLFSWLVNIWPWYEELTKADRDL